MRPGGFEPPTNSLEGHNHPDASDSGRGAMPPEASRAIADLPVLQGVERGLGNIAKGIVMLPF